MAYEEPHMPTKDEILEFATKMFMAEQLRAGMPAIIPEEDELKEGSYWDRARIELMSGVKTEMEQYLTYLEEEAESIRDQLGIKPAPPPREVRELVEQIDIVSGKLSETRRNLREARETIEKLRAIKIPPKVVAPPPPKLEEKAYRVLRDFEEKINGLLRYKTGDIIKTTEHEWAEAKIREGLLEPYKLEVPAPPPPPKRPICPAHNVELTPVVGTHEFPWGPVEVPGEMFLFQCPMEWEYYICEPRKACELVSLDKLKLKLARIIRPIIPPRVRPRLRLPTAEIQPDFPDFLRECGITPEQYKRLDHTGKTVMRNEYRRWKEQPY